MLPVILVPFNQVAFSSACIGAGMVEVILLVYFSVSGEKYFISMIDIILFLNRA